MAGIRAATTARTFVVGWVARSRVPAQATTDGGAQFESGLWQHLSALLGCLSHRTTSYHLQGNSMVERSACPDISDDADFLHYKMYADCVLYRLVQTVSDVTGMPRERVMHSLGQHFLPFAVEIGFGDIIHGIGQTFETFLQNIDYLHWYLMSTAFAGTQSPSFRPELVGREGEALALNYYSRRDCCTGIVTGLLQAVARNIFSINIKISTVSVHKEMVSNRPMVHVIFRITQHPIGMPRISLNWMKEWPESVQLVKKRTHTRGDGLAVGGKLFGRIHPYHIVFDRRLTILQTGAGLGAQIPETQLEGARLDHVFCMTWPEVTLSVANIERFSNLVFQLEYRKVTRSGKRFFCLKGSIVGMAAASDGAPLELTDAPLFLYLGSPLARSVRDLERMALKISDIPSHDSTRDLILLKDQRGIEFDVMQQLEKTTSELAGTATALQKEMRRTDELLHSMIPPLVAVKLKRNEPVQETFDEVTILFSDVVTFTQIAASCTPVQVVQLLNQLYTYFDQLTEHNNVYKVETIGDAYMVVGGCPEVNSEHAALVATQAHQMIRGAGHVLVPTTDKQVQIRVGMHTGPVVAGIVGVKMPRYCLFGDTVNTASRMESHGLSGHVHISHCTYTCLRSNPRFFFERRGQIPVKGKGMMSTYFVHEVQPSEPVELAPVAPAYIQYKSKSRPLVIVPHRHHPFSGVCLLM
ncbi:guanylate cyclase soluble subunit beta-2-like [Pollicipes pollicipes]|uniref:guanylate cyclase soluble subunit beta-2-like n=1 Tax=Pollicipes pollicipes TaxID=41117 RepID=UPI0018850A4C|nr:guanylate cyclase soluble subunit beta-2-like [Pollicipes pollicipes]